MYLELGRTSRVICCSPQSPPPPRLEAFSSIFSTLNWSAVEDPEPLGCSQADPGPLGFGGNMALVSFNVRQLFGLPLSFMTLAFLSTSQNVLPFEFVCCFLMVKFRWCIFYKNTMEVMFCPSQWIVSRGTWYWFILFLVMLMLIIWLR